MKLRYILIGVAALVLAVVGVKGFAIYKRYHAVAQQARRDGD